MTIVALVAMITVASVAHAQSAVIVSGNIASGTLSITGCTIPLTAISRTAVVNAGCGTPGDIVANSPLGINITLQGDVTYGNTLDADNSTDIIATPIDIAGDQDCVGTNECYAFGAVTLANAGAVTYSDPTSDWTPVLVAEEASTNDSVVATDHIPIPANGNAEPIVNDTDAGLLTGATWDMNLYASAGPGTDAGDYTGGLLITIAENT